MSQIDTSEKDLSQISSGHSEAEDVKLVPVTESIRYRKRAQLAEKQNESLAKELSEAKSKTANLTEELHSIRIEQELMRKLTVAGVVDLETAVLIAKKRMENSEESDTDQMIGQLKKEKQYLFVDVQNNVMGPQRTSGVKDRHQSNQTMLSRAAKKAATTGNRTDLQEYLKLRRNIM